MARPIWMLVASLLALHAGAFAATGPVLSETGPDAAAYGAADGYPVPQPGQPVVQSVMVGFYSHYDRVRDLPVVARGGAVVPLRRAAAEIAPQYRFRDATYSIADYLERNPATGLLIARDDTILYEHYRYGRTEQDRFLSQSMAKTITALLVGIAVSERAIGSIDDPAERYVPELAGSEYGATALRALLHMSSGVAYHETYEPGDDSEKLGRAVFPRNAPGAVAAVRQFDRRDAPAGTRFYYAGAETEVLGLVVSRAVGMSLADYAGTRIWQKLGAEADAGWAADATGQVTAFCCFVATLRDWARLGLMLAHDGAWNGQQIVPRQWLLDATTVAPGEQYLAPGRATRRLGYGYQVWLLPGGDRQFALLGIHGQAILVDPQRQLVLVHTAVRVRATGDPRIGELYALWDAVAAEQTPAR